MCVHEGTCACPDPGLWGGGLQVSNSSAIFRGHISSAVWRLGCVSVGKSQSLCPWPLTLQHGLSPTPCLSSESLHRPFHTCCYHPPPPGGIPGARSLPGHSLSAAGSGQGWAAPTGGAWGEGGEQGRGCGQCYFELLTEQHLRRDSLLWAAPGQAMRVSVPLTPTPEMSQAPHAISSFRKGGPICDFPRCG